MEIYLDNAATTKPFREVTDAMQPYIGDEYGNPSTIYAIGRRARKALDDARDKVADILGVKSMEVIFCSGATESICTSLIGVALETVDDRKRFVTTTIEHHAVLETAHWLEKYLGWDVTLISPKPGGHVDANEFIDACTDRCGLASLQWVNNEIGTIQPVEEIASKLADTPTVFHTDIVQGIGKMRIDIDGSGIDMASASGHKFYGPKGVGITYIREGSVKLCPLIVGGGQELERRAGTENVTGCVGLAKALNILASGRDSLSERLKELMSRFIQVLDRAGVEYEINGTGPKVHGIVNFFFPGIESESMLLHADRAGVFISAGSACSSGTTQPSYVIAAMGHNKMRGLCSVRISLGWHNTVEEVEEGAKRISEIAIKLRGST